MVKLRFDACEEILSTSSLVVWLWEMIDIESLAVVESSLFACVVVIVMLGLAGLFGGVGETKVWCWVGLGAHAINVKSSIGERPRSFMRLDAAHRSSWIGVGRLS